MNSTGNEDVIKFFDGLAGSYRENYLRPEFVDRQRVFLGAVGRGGGRQLLDVGCGEGSLARAYAESGFAVLGTDASSAMVGLATGDSVAGSVNFELQTFPFSEEWIRSHEAAFDVVTSSSLFEYLSPSDIKLGLEQIAQLLRPSGVLVISVPNTASIVRVAERIFRRLRLNGPSYLRFQYAGDLPQIVPKFAGISGLTLRESCAFALPLHRFLGPLLQGRRPRRLSTMECQVYDRTIA